MSIDQKTIHISFQVHGGSAEHYYHFLLGFLVPLTLVHNKETITEKECKIYIKTCAIMDRHINHINFTGVTILDKSSHEKSKFTEMMLSRGIENLQFTECKGYDRPDYYMYSEFCAAKKLLVEKLSSDIAIFKNHLINMCLSSTPVVVIINREEQHPFYASDESEIKTAGTTRRSIPNFNELYEVISSHYPNTVSTTLESKSLAYQISLFDYADIIVAQHGASLANLIWCNPETTLIEIHPNNLPKSISNIDYFKTLAICMDLNYLRVNQNGKHSEINVSEVMNMINLGIKANKKLNPTV